MRIPETPSETKATLHSVMPCAAFPAGLKLQGQIGKFGNVELSDIAAFVEMPDGKVRLERSTLC